ncbi:nicotinate-nucleotide--dimethylbenzimidazole phosphoribosyltransferase [uncultured Endozoicomonas sp.]|uniref:nicotinate-nucleotide--dimethylbenzimidazole phosphoribosyltransferase n=1 Tax=uncultured Endozoicomonas sp. TaxID=432652 RepID=UPI00262E833D|nr:nicotinate-nucleotide--dimethylbenzimidazole phosphoribosyltransferase [uncultured Endozoicomonas sp.]
MNQAHSDAIWHRIHQKTKPVGALGQLESLAHQLALIQSQSKDAAVANIEIHSPTAIVFAGADDHCHHSDISLAV